MVLPIRHSTFPVDIKQTASQRSEPSSRSLLMGEHPHPWTLLHAQDRKSRHRCSKPRRRSTHFVRVLTKQNLSSRARQLCYPRSNFSVISSPHQGGLGGSLDHNFLSEFCLIKNTVRLAFALALYIRFLTGLSQPLGPVDIFSTGCHPSQTVHIMVSFFRSEQRKF